MGDPGDDTGRSWYEHFAAWLGQAEPEYLAAVARCVGERGVAGLLAVWSWGPLLYSGESAGRNIDRDTLAVLRRYIEALSVGADELRVLGDGADAGYRPASPARLRALLPADHLTDHALGSALHTALQSIYDGALDIGGERQPARVFPRAAAATEEQPAAAPAEPEDAAAAQPAEPAPKPPPSMPASAYVAAMRAAGKSNAAIWREVQTRGWQGQPGYTRDNLRLPRPRDD